jgi:hypothetical protein
MSPDEPIPSDRLDGEHPHAGNGDVHVVAVKQVRQPLVEVGIEGSKDSPKVEQRATFAIGRLDAGGVQHAAWLSTLA